eukprot:GFYU01007442.1.p1 GENE.GFYU01007442.1~~GFYU01007442.1.p1  ORF type:complete len:427 (+),score=124.08 GFYU01007442.1:108-1388(+)
MSALDYDRIAPSAPSTSNNPRKEPKPLPTLSWPGFDQSQQQSSVNKSAYGDFSDDEDDEAVANVPHKVAFDKLRTMNQQSPQVDESKFLSQVMDVAQQDQDQVKTMKDNLIYDIDRIQQGSEKEEFTRLYHNIVSLENDMAAATLKKRLQKLQGDVLTHLDSEAQRMEQLGQFKAQQIRESQAKLSFHMKSMKVIALLHFVYCALLTYQPMLPFFDKDFVELEPYLWYLVYFGPVFILDFIVVNLAVTRQFNFLAAYGFWSFLMVVFHGGFMGFILATHSTAFEGDNLTKMILYLVEFVLLLCEFVVALILSTSWNSAHESEPLPFYHTGELQPGVDEKDFTHELPAHTQSMAMSGLSHNVDTLGGGFNSFNRGGQDTFGTTQEIADQPEEEVAEPTGKTGEIVCPHCFESVPSYVRNCTVCGKKI